MVSVLDQLIDFLESNQADPLTYLLLFFLFSVAAAIILPIPVEIGLVINRGMFFPIKALDLGLGKCVGAIAVFFIPRGIGYSIRFLRRWRPVKRFLVHANTVAEKTGIYKSPGYAGLRRMVDAMHAAMVKSGIDGTHLYQKMQRRARVSPAAGARPRWGWLRWLAEGSEKLTRKYGVFALYAIMSIPGMIDTVVLYVFAIINVDRPIITLRDFALANFLAGINRAFIIYALLEILGIRLF